MTTIRSALTLTLLLAFSIAGAARLPDYYPDSFQRVGTVDGIYLERQVIVINDFQYFLSDAMVVHTVANQFDTIDMLSPGATIGFRVIGDGTGQALIPEIWVLPASMGRSTE